MSTPSFINCHSCRAIMSAFICLILIPILAMSLSIDEIILSNSTSPHSFDFFHINSNGTVEIKLEYDMLLSIDQYKGFTTQAKRQGGNRAAVRDISLWPDEKVYFEVTREMWSTRNVILEAVREWQKYTCLEFIESNKSNRIVFINGDSCNSYIGYCGFVQEIKLRDICKYKQIILHEVGHALGFSHEHTRPDRDYYIFVDTDKTNKNWRKWNFTDINAFGIQYDYRSIMHYKGVSGKMETLDPAYQDIIGMGKYLSFKDIKGMNLLYQCRIKYGKCPPRRCSFNGFVLSKPLKGMPKCTCWCESGNSNDPLIPCCQIDREVPGPNIPARSSNSELKITTCYDLRDNCGDLRKKGMCLSNIIMMFKECTKTCNFCGKGDNLCMDYEDGCHMMADSGACKEEGLEEVMSQLCKKSCGLCRTAATPCDIQKALFEQL